MSHRGWINFTRAGSAVGLAAFALFILAAPDDSSWSGFFDTWVYNGLIVLACVTAGSYVYLVKQERAAWTVVTLALVSWTFSELWHAILGPGRIRSWRMPDSSPSTSCCTSESCSCSSRGPARSQAHSGWTA